jgi:hypothetical protein
MTITQTVDIPANRRLTIDVPPEIPAGPVILTFTTAKEEPATNAPSAQKKVPVFGCAKGKYRMAEDFDAPLDDFKDYM